jgi:hypothetical protein
MAKVTLQIVDEGGPTVALHIYTEGDLHHGAGRMASIILAQLSIDFAEKGVLGFGDTFHQDVKDMVRYHVEKAGDQEENTPKPSPN